MGSRAGALRTAAKRVGVSPEAYQQHVSTGQKWCTACKTWHPIEDFPRDRTRGDGRKAACLASARGKPRTQRDPLHEQARRVVAYAVRTGRLPHASTVPCADCGHTGTDRRHERDHHQGYAPEHHLDTEVVCTTCHADRERARRG